MQALNRFIGFVIVAATVGLVISSDTPTVDDPWFQASVLENSRPVVVKFGADWCPPCRSMDEALSKVRGSFPEARFVKINIDESPGIFRAFRSGSGIPQVAVFRDGSVVARTRGFAGEAALRSWLRESL